MDRKKGEKMVWEFWAGKKREKLFWEFWAVKKGGITDLGIVTGKRGRNQFGNCGQ